MNYTNITFKVFSLSKLFGHNELYRKIIIGNYIDLFYFKNSFVEYSLTTQWKEEKYIPFTDKIYQEIDKIFLDNGADYNDLILVEIDTNNDE